MTKNDAPEFLAALGQCADVLQEELSARTQAGYWLALQDLPLEAFQCACIAVMRQERGFPVPVVFRAYAEARMQREPATDQRAQLAQRERLLRKHGFGDTHHATE